MVVPEELMAASNCCRGGGIDVGERPNATLVHGDVAACEAGVGKDVGDDGKEIFELLLGGDRSCGITFERDVGGADERAFAEREQEYGAAVTGFGVDALAPE